MSVDNMFFAFLIDVIDTVKPDCIEYFLKELLGKGGYKLPNSTIQYTNNIICGYYDALNKLQNKKYFFKYFNYFEKIGELLYIRSKKLYAKYKFFHSYIIKHKLPTNVKELAISGADLKTALPKLPEKKYGAVLQEMLDKVFDGAVINEKNVLLQELKNDNSNRDN